jgi:WD40 repeat protein
MVSYDQSVRLWDVATGKLLRTYPGSRKKDASGLGMAFIPNGKIRAMENYPVPSGGKRTRVWENYYPVPSPSGGKRTRVWEVTTGKELCRLNIPDFSDREPKCFSPDGKLLAVARVKNVNLAGKEIGQLTGHQAEVNAVAFSADGKTLASGSNDLTCLIWDVSPWNERPKPASVRPLSLKQIEAAWQDLALLDAAKAYRAIDVLSGAPKQAIPWLQEQVRPIILTQSQQRQLTQRLSGN